MLWWIILILVVILIIALVVAYSFGAGSIWYLLIIGFFVFMIIAIMVYAFSQPTRPTVVQTSMNPTPTSNVYVTPTHTEVHHDLTSSPVSQHQVTHDHFHHQGMQTTEAAVAVPTVPTIPPMPTVNVSTTSRSVPPAMRQGVPEGYRATTTAAVGRTTIDPDPTATTTYTPGSVQRVRVRDERGVEHWATLTGPAVASTTFENRPPAPATFVPPGYVPARGQQAYTILR